MNVSILIDELEARKNDYILVADVINAMSNATNSAPDEVVKYLNAHDIDEHLTVFYMGENYSFYQYNGFLINVGNDANTTYFRMSDVLAFEPITKHGIFKESQATNGMVHDVYGRTYDVNQHKKNREDEYLTVSETLDFLNYNTDVNSLSYDHVKLRDIARRKLITPCFYFDGYVGSFRGDSNDSDNGFYTEIITGYFTYRLLTEEICRYDDYMKLPNDGVMIYSILEKKTAEYVDYDDVFLFYDKPQGLNEAEKLKLTHIEADEIRFSKRALNSYIASLTNTSQDDVPAQNDGELLAKLEQLQAENSDLNARLFTARNTYKQNQNEIKELKAQLEKANADNAALNEQLSNKIDAPADDNTLQTILNESHDYHAPDLKHAIQLWIDLYVNDGIKSDSHSNKAAQWISRNTDYAENAKTSTDRIKEISSPSKYWSPHRKKEV